MTPAEIITPHLLDADRIKPHLKIDNRYASCGELLEDALLRGGPDWHFIGKSSRKGESGFRPAWLTPTWLDLRRDDGQVESVLIDLLGMDAAWYLPTHEQVKVIVNSTANELPIGDPRRGPARLTPYMIPQFGEDGKLQWRWHNPPIAQRPGVAVPPPLPPPTPAPTHDGSVRLPSYAELGDAAFFVGKIGQRLYDDMHTNGEEMNAGSADWIARAVHGTIERFMQHGDHRDADAIATKVQNEWRAVMKNPKLPQLP